MSHHLGLCIGDTMAEIVELFRDGPTITVAAMGEWPVGPRLEARPITDRLRAFLKANDITATGITVALSTSRLIIHAFPVPADAPRPTYVNTARWELAQILRGQPVDGYITDATAFSRPADGEATEVLSISLRREDIALLRGAAEACDLDMDGVDADHFCAETLCLERTPGGLPPASILVTLRADRIDWSLLGSTESRRYGTEATGGSASMEDAVNAVIGRTGPVDRIILSGPHATEEAAALLRNRLGVAAECLDPFATIAVPASLPLIGHFMRAPQRFAAATGAALRAEDRG